MSAAVCIAQTTTPPPVPASLFVPDAFVRAVKNQSSGPSYLMATIVNDTTGEKLRVCIEGTQLFAAVHTENRLGRGRTAWDKTLRLILDNVGRTYHFTNSDAWQQAQPRYTPAMLATVGEQFRSLSTEELAERFSYAKTQGFIKIDEKASPVEVFSYCTAVAYVLTERGLLAGRGDFGNSLYVITPQMLAEKDKREQRYIEEQRQTEAEGQAFAIHLPGYQELTREYEVNKPEVSEYQPGLCFSVSLETRSPRLVDSVDWLNPVNPKTRKARYDWNQFLPIAAHIERLACLYPWLREWKKSGPKRTIEAQMYGKNIHGDFEEDVKRDLMPAWKDAGMRGKPYCQLALRWWEGDEGASATLYLPLPGSGEDRALILSTYHPRDGDMSAPSLHWLDKLSFESSSSAKVRQAVVVTPAGDWKQVSLPASRD